MLTTTTAWLIAIGVITLASLMMWTLGRMRGAGKVEIIRKRFFCPAKGKEVEVDFLTWLGRTGDLLGVKACSAFPAGEEIDCERACLHLPQAQAAPALHA